MWLKHITGFLFSRKKTIFPDFPDCISGIYLMRTRSILGSSYVTEGCFPKNVIWSPDSILTINLPAPKLILKSRKSRKYIVHNIFLARTCWWRKNFQCKKIKLGKNNNTRITSLISNLNTIIKKI